MDTEFHPCAGSYGGGGVHWVRANPPSSTCGKKSEPNHFVAVQDLIEGSELKVSLKRLKFCRMHYTHCPPFCYDIIGQLQPCCDEAPASAGSGGHTNIFSKRADLTGGHDGQ